MKAIKAENYLPTEIEKFIKDCKEETEKSEHRPGGFDGVQLETIWRMNFYRYFAEELSKNPVCPHCNKKMSPRYFTGYYDSFSFWECNCKKIPGADECSGQYA
jgi:hypothetical protein